MQQRRDPAKALAVLEQQVVRCHRCPRLVAWREEVAHTKRRAYQDWVYWGKPVPAWGDAQARLLVVALAPGAHGANRTGRMFTGDRSGQFLYRAMYECGFCNQPTSEHQGDGLQLIDTWMTAAARCVPPDNKPLPDELRNCRPYLMQELALQPQLRVAVVLGKIAHDAYLNALYEEGRIARRSEYEFGHGAEYSLGPDLPRLLCSYHPSQQNTSTKRLTLEMLTRVFVRAREIVDA